jgi:hypothetical protein
MENPNEKVKRPTFLLVLAILSLITIGFALLGNLSGLISGPLSEDEMELVMSESMKILEPLSASGMNDMSDTFEKVFRMQIYINANFYTQTLITIAYLLIGLFGVIFMLKGKKNGFHLYIVYNILSIVAIYVSVPANEVPNIMIGMNVLFSALFIFLYSRNLHWMKVN